ncbi:unnamed protein product [Rangifer tarandus platyrhynchus]|uniref:Uncharacterized protein n=1 Tax=Rangifer tarandus platyrhynchus TaxID=3082113 RepID=A0ABN8YVE6_RANTA|nr:unnamed protein product [Rangifer tarandus platyrhynchus]
MWLKLVRTRPPPAAIVRNQVFSTGAGTGAGDFSAEVRQAHDTIRSAPRREGSVTSRDQGRICMHLARGGLGWGSVALPPLRVRAPSASTPRPLRRDRPSPTNSAQVKTRRWFLALRDPRDVEHPRPPFRILSSPGEGGEAGYQGPGRDLRAPPHRSRQPIRNLQPPVPLPRSRASAASCGRAGPAQKVDVAPAEPARRADCPRVGRCSPGVSRRLPETPVFGLGTASGCPVAGRLLRRPLGPRSRDSGCLPQNCQPSSSL